MSTSCCWYIIFTLSGQNTVTSVISSYKYQYCKYRKTIWTDLSNSNSCRPVLQIPQCICQTSLNAPLRTEMCPSPFWTVHRGTLPRHHRGHRWLSVRITLSARWRLAHRLKATSRGRKWAQMASFSRKMSPPAISGHHVRCLISRDTDKSYTDEHPSTITMSYKRTFIIFLCNLRQMINVSDNVNHMPADNLVTIQYNTIQYNVYIIYMVIHKTRICHGKYQPFMGNLFLEWTVRSGIYFCCPPHRVVFAIVPL